MMKRGQAAMEFLMTYGWAILAAVVVIGVLAYFGVFKPSTYVPEQCVLSAPLGCNAWNANTTGINLEIRNGAGETINVTGISVSISTPSGVSCNAVTPNANLADGDKSTYYITCSGLTSGTKIKGDITVTYKKSGSDLEQTSSGSIVTKVT